MSGFLPNRLAHCQNPRLTQPNFHSGSLNLIFMFHEGWMNAIIEAIYFFYLIFPFLKTNSLQSCHNPCLDTRVRSSGSTMVIYFQTSLQPRLKLTWFLISVRPRWTDENGDNPDANSPWKTTKQIKKETTWFYLVAGVGQKWAPTLLPPPSSTSDFMGSEICEEAPVGSVPCWPLQSRLLFTCSLPEWKISSAAVKILSKGKKILPLLVRDWLMEELFHVWVAGRYLDGVHRDLPQRGLLELLGISHVFDL